MTTKQPFISSRFFVAACLVAASCWFSTSASARDLSQEAEPSGALSRLHNLTSRASELATRAVEMLGIRYKYGSNSPEHGLDCSGLVQYVFKDAWGKELPRTSAEISRAGERIDVKELQPGDLVFYNTLRRGFSHVGIYLGDNKFIHSPSAGGKVRIESMDLSYWKKRFNGARRIEDTAQ
jgi:cell wall-associated NlpC family hydrolase